MSSDFVILCAPTQFEFNPETAKSNHFMESDQEAPYDVVQAEFAQVTDTLKAARIPFHILESPGSQDKPTPDAVFVNNWFCYMPSGLLTLFPMKTENRAEERNNTETLKRVLPQNGFTITEVMDLSHYEQHGRALESTGSIVFDHQSRVAFAVISERTDPEIFEEFVSKIGYQACTFNAVDKQGHDIYHTNVVMMGLAKHIIVCLEAITDAVERQRVMDVITSTGKSLIDITLDQMYHFCGNCIDVHVSGDNHLLMSQTAWSHFTTEQQQIFDQNYRVHALPIPTLETIGGGSVRCMIGKISKRID